MPQHIRNILIATILAALALIAGIKGYIHHQFKTSIDRTLSQLQVFAQVRYSDLSTSIISGEVVLQNVRVNSNYLPEELRLGNVTFETPGLSFMLNGPSSFQSGEFPDHLGVAIDDFYLDLNDELAGWLEKLVIQFNRVYANHRTICGGKAVFGPAEYREMGYTRILSNLRIAYDFNEDSKQITFYMNADTRNMGKVNITAEVHGLSQMSAAGMTQGGMPHLKHLEATYQDDSYTPRMIRYCAKESKMEKEAFIEAEVNQSDEYFQLVWGFAPGAGLRDAYKDFLIKPGKVVLTMEPSSEFNPMLAPNMSPVEVLEALNTKLTVNGLDVLDLSFTLPPAELVEKYQNKLEKSMDFDALLQGKAVKPVKPLPKPKLKVEKKKEYHVIKVENAKRHISDYVRVKTKNGHERSGQLIDVDKQKLYIQKKVHSGKFTVQVLLTNVEKIEAYFIK